MNENLAVLSFWLYFLLKSLDSEETQHKISIYRGFEEHYWENFYCIFKPFITAAQYFYYWRMSDYQIIFLPNLSLRFKGLLPIFFLTNFFWLQNIIESKMRIRPSMKGRRWTRCEWKIFKKRGGVVTYMVPWSKKSKIGRMGSGRGKEKLSREIVNNNFHRILGWNSSKCKMN